ncbi:SAF domain protein [Rosistilla oblonga]|uniref:SAF domain protein n=1 Tax=Rosistilla oblonga TaxID=2527990 RepID=A0A518IVK2_9BACT|nr:Flp pilus assembly protein CpaB [Rosistilla oblonga]QDV14745.1 SAF domain protein [Rosistilla oblonga]QDV57109.1 SAF domain protein [Rosistilla oblonga]
MRNKSVILLAIALGCGMIASVGISQVVMSGSEAQPTKMVEILVASMDIPSNAKIAADNIMLEKWPAGKTPEGAITDVTAIENKYAKQHIYAGEAILKQKVVDATERATVGIPPGHTVVTYSIGSDPGIANLIEPGDRINVIGFFEKSDIVPETTHRDVFRNVKIFAVDGRTSRETEEKAKRGPVSSILLLIKQEDERVWNWAKKVGSLQLTLGNPNEPVNPNTPNAAGIEFMKWLDDYAEERRLGQVETKPTEVLVEKPGGEIIKMLTPKGYRLFRWNKGTQTMELIQEHAPNDAQLGAGTSAADAGAVAPDASSGLPGAASVPQVDAGDSSTVNEAYRINRAR